jgi:hypothetical protein
MKRTVVVLVACVLTMGFAGMLQAETAPQVVVDLAQSTLAKLGSDPVIVAAVKAQNAQGKSLDDIKALDDQWKDTPGIVDYMRAIMESDCGRHLQEIQNSADYYSEIFVMDNQGANVAMTDKTSDYWQGDEAKFTESFKDGAGALYLGEVEFDDSTQAYLVQVSVPVNDNGAAIGAITIGVDVDRIE